MGQHAGKAELSERTQAPLGRRRGSRKRLWEQVGARCGHDNSMQFSGPCWKRGGPSKLHRPVWAVTRVSPPMTGCWATTGPLLAGNPPPRACPGRCTLHLRLCCLKVTRRFFAACRAGRSGDPRGGFSSSLPHGLPATGRFGAWSTKSKLRRPSLSASDRIPRVGPRVGIPPPSAATDSA